MITVTLPDRIVVLTFTYRTGMIYLKSNPLQPVHVSTTKCEIHELDPNDHMRIPFLARGEAHCSENDVFCKDVGRKIALTRALETNIPCQHAKEFKKYDRGQIWMAYWNRS